MLTIIASFTYCTIKKYAYADYEDLTSDTLVSFNQYVKNQYTHDYNKSSGDFYAMETSGMNLAVGDLIYVHLIKEQENDVLMAFNNGTLHFPDKTNDVLIRATAVNLNTLRFYLPSTTYVYSLWFINLTQMFGNNEPTLEQCKQIFAADYYSYTTGTAMYKGIGDFQYKQDLSINLNTGTLTGYPQNVTNTQVFYNAYNQLELTATYSENYAAYYLINFKTSVPVNSIITLNFESYTLTSNATICYVNENETYITNIPQSTQLNKPFTFQFVNSEEISSLYLIIDSYSTGTIMNISKANIELRFSTDTAIDLQRQYDLGYLDAVEYYTNGYGRTEIWTEGYILGRAQGLEDANGSFEAMDYVKQAFILIGDIFTIEVFPNFPLGAFFLLPLITGAVFFVIKIAKGGS